MEKTALESRVSSLSEEVVDLQFKADSAEKLQVLFSRPLLTRDTKTFCDRVACLANVFILHKCCFWSTGAITAVSSAVASGISWNATVSRSAFKR